MQEPYLKIVVDNQERHPKMFKKLVAQCKDEIIHMSDYFTCGAWNVDGMVRRLKGTPIIIIMCVPCMILFLVNHNVMP